MVSKALLTLSMLFLCVLGAVAYKPVVLIHGVLSSGDALSDLKNLILKYHPGTPVYALNVFDGSSAVFNSMHKQTDAWNDAIKSLGLGPGGFHIIAHSQGGLMARNYIETVPNHGVENFIALSSPLNGQFGDTILLRYILPNSAPENAYKYLYNPLGQAEFSIAGYWRDPHHQAEYLKHCTFLPRVNNEVSHLNAKAYKANFLQLKNLVLIGGPQDGVIEPWQSAHFASYDENMKVVDMRNQTFYLEDSFGLKTLDQRGGVHMHTSYGVIHTAWHGNENVFVNQVLPWLN